MSIFRPLSEVAGPGSYQIAGVNITCPHCQNQEFLESRVQYSINESAYGEPQFAGKVATMLTCSKCSMMLYFAHKPDIIIEK